MIRYIKHRQTNENWRRKGQKRLFSCYDGSKALRNLSREGLQDSTIETLRGVVSKNFYFVAFFFRDGIRGVIFKRRGGEGRILRGPYKILVRGHMRPSFRKMDIPGSRSKASPEVSNAAPSRDRPPPRHMSRTAGSAQPLSRSNRKAPVITTSVIVKNGEEPLSCCENLTNPTRSALR
jgi:hypothetical protein